MDARGVRIDQQYMPFGRLSMATILKAREILMEIKYVQHVCRQWPPPSVALDWCYGLFGIGSREFLVMGAAAVVVVRMVVS